MKSSSAEEIDFILSKCLVLMEIKLQETCVVSRCFIVLSVLQTSQTMITHGDWRVQPVTRDVTHHSSLHWSRSSCSGYLFVHNLTDLNKILFVTTSYSAAECYSITFLRSQRSLLSDFQFSWTLDCSSFFYSWPSALKRSRVINWKMLLYNRNLSS